MIIVFMLLVGHIQSVGFNRIHSYLQIEQARGREAGGSILDVTALFGCGRNEKY